MAKKKKSQKVIRLEDLPQLIGFSKSKTDTSMTKKEQQGNTQKKNKHQANIGWLFFKDYYHNFNFTKTEKNGHTKESVEEYQNPFFKEKNDRIFQQNIKTLLTHLLKQKNALGPVLTTTYPGLATGTGISHESKSQGEIKLGFSFDYTTGLPYLPASSVKGLLRSVFPQKNIKKKLNINKFSVEHRTYLKEQLAEIGITDLVQRFSDRVESKGFTPDLANEYDFIDLLEMELFEGLTPSVKKQIEAHEIVNWEWKANSVYNRDIFHDAYPSASTNKEGMFLGDDFITPHENPLKNPKPVKFMKILPGVGIQFQFDMKDGIIPKEKKIELFELILKDFGVGAKTNVGYGQLE